MVGREWRIFWSSTVSKVGVLLLSLMALASLYVLMAYPPDFGERVWNNPGYWADYPREAPPVWVNIFAVEKLPEHMVATRERPTLTYSDGRYIHRIYEIPIEYRYDGYPSFLSFSLEAIQYHASPPIIEVSIIRPDSQTITIYVTSVSSPFPGEDPPYRRYVDQPFRVYLSRESQVIQSIQRFLQERGVTLTLDDVERLGPERVIFQELSAHGLSGRVLHGLYRVRVNVISDSAEDRVGWVRFVTGGRVYGISGTDKVGRDLAAGLLFGFPVALLIGFVTSGLTTSIGSALGILSGYVGGRVDELIQRASDILNNIPLLPLLIFFTFVFRPSIWLIVLILVAFGWSGLTIVVRAMVLQVKAEQFIEAAVSLGATRWRIMARHIFPRIAPFIFAQMIFSTPSAILAEAALSFLGLGDPSMPSWGQILDYSFRSGGVNVGLWWWIVPPGVLIVLTGITFVLLSLGLEPVVAPRLRRLR